MSKSPSGPNDYGLINQTPLTYPPQFDKGLIAGLIKRNQWVFVSPDHKAGYFQGRYVGGVG